MGTSWHLLCGNSCQLVPSSDTCLVGYELTSLVANCGTSWHHLWYELTSVRGTSWHGYELTWVRVDMDTSWHEYELTGILSIGVTNPHVTPARIIIISLVMVLWCGVVVVIVIELIQGRIQLFSEGGCKIWHKKYFTVKGSRGPPPGGFLISKGFVMQSKAYRAVFLL